MSDAAETQITEHLVEKWAMGIIDAHFTVTHDPKLRKLAHRQLSGTDNCDGLCQCVGTDESKTQSELLRLVYNLLTTELVSVFLPEQHYKQVRDRVKVWLEWNSAQPEPQVTMP